MEHKIQSCFPPQNKKKIFYIMALKLIDIRGLEPAIIKKIMYSIVLQINFTNIKINILKLRLFGFQI